MNQQPLIRAFKAGMLVTHEQAKALSKMYCQELDKSVREASREDVLSSQRLTHMLIQRARRT